MKLAPRTFRIEWDLHAWSGVIASTFLFVIFFCGIFALIHEELHTWQDPALHVPKAPPGAPAPSFDALLALAKRHASIPEGASVGLGLDGTRIGHVWIEHLPSELERELTFDLATGKLLPEHTRLADELYSMHFFYRVPGGQEVAGLIAAGLFVALISGLAMHVKDIKRQLWSFRPRLRLRWSASDAHKVLGVFGLPFTMMFAWTGALLGLWTLVFSGIAGAAFQGDLERTWAARGQQSPTADPAGNAVAMQSFDALYERARAATRAGDARVSWLGTQLYGDERARTRVYFEGSGFALEPYAVLDTHRGQVLRTQHDAPPSAGFERAMFALHFGSYGGLLVDLLYALLALAVCAVIVTGNVVWLERRDPEGRHPGNRFLARLTAGLCAGCVLSVACYFAANRVLPPGLASRADWELGVYLAVWALATLAAFVPRWTARQHAAAQGTLAAAVYLGVIAFDAVALDTNIVTAVARGVPSVLVIELLLLLLGIASAALAWLLARSTPQPRTAGLYRLQ